MRIKKLKRRCMVNGCRNMVSYSITRRNQLGNSIHICADCMKEALKAIDEIEKKAEKTQVPVLSEQTDTEDADVQEKADSFECPVCGKVCKTENGLKKHMETHAGAIL